jgi:hypothetical protein
MSRLLLFYVSYRTLHIMHCTMLCSAHLYLYTLDPADPKLEEPTELAPAEESANTELTEDKPQCIPPIILGFCFNLLPYVMDACALSL